MYILDNNILKLKPQRAQNEGEKYRFTAESQFTLCFIIFFNYLKSLLRA